jgi:hypothetical protein
MLPDVCFTLFDFETCHSPPGPLPADPMLPFGMAGSGPFAAEPIFPAR